MLQAETDLTVPLSKELLSFYLASELYGVPIGSVEEIRVWEVPTPLPNAPSFIKGVINLRGMIVPIMDLRIRFGISDGVYNATTVILVLCFKQDDIQRIIGVVVDAVEDVVPTEGLLQSPAVGESLVMPFATGLLNINEHVLTVLDTSALLNLDDVL